MTTQLLGYQTLKQAVQSDVALRAIRRLQPAGGPGDKLFPPTYGVADNAPHKYALERRRIDGKEVDAVLLDAVQSQANRMEQALLESWRGKEANLPVVTVDFSDSDGLSDLGEITSLDAPHRLADALLRDSIKDGKPFRLSPEGQAFTDARITDATALYRLCPTALIFGIWDSTGPKGGLGAKFARVLVSEIVGIGAVRGSKTSSRIDPAQIMNVAKDSPIYVKASDPRDWTRDAAEALKEKGKPVLLGDGRPSEINHGNVTPSIDDRAGGVTVDYVLQTIVLSLVGLRRLQFPSDVAGKAFAAEKRAEGETAARTVLAALGLAAVVLQEQRGYDLRSRCLLVPESPLHFEIVGASGGETRSYSLDHAASLALLKEAVEAARTAGMAWSSKAGEPVLRLKPAPKLVDLIRRSRELASTGVAE